MAGASGPPLRMDLCWWSILALAQLFTSEGQGSARAELLRRVRRKWVWNQFFVLEEYAGQQPLYVGKLHSDLDTGDGSVEYVVSGEGAGTVFAVDASTGDLHAVRRLDREAKAQYALHARALRKHTGLPLEPETQFIVRVLDVNDNEPRFLGGPFRATVPEMSSIGTSVIRLTAVDADDPAYGSSAIVVYTLLQGQPYFSVEAKTGILRVSLPDLDREERGVYHVIVQAKDMGGQQGGLESTVTVTVTLSDVNDSPPRFTQELYELSVPELSAEGDVVAQIQAEDPDEGVNAYTRYCITGGDGEDTFAVTTDPTNRYGVITVKKHLDFETRQSYTLTVEGTNMHSDPRFLHLGPFSDIVTIRLNVEDMDEPPQFCETFYYIEVPEDVGVGFELVTLSAADPDMANDSIRYSIERMSDPDRFFYVDSYSGSLTTERALDRERHPWHNITVLAMEMNNPSQMGSTAVIIKVLDVNDNPPRLEQCEVFICDNAKPGQLVYTLRAVDEDDPYGSQLLHYSLHEEDPNSTRFVLRDNQDSTAGVVVQEGGPSTKAQTAYYLPILIRDEGPPALTGTSTLTVRMCQCSKDGSMMTCAVERHALRNARLSRGVLLLILTCVILSLVVVLLAVTFRSRRTRHYHWSEEGAGYESMVHYNDEGGGEADTSAFDLAAMWTGKAQRGARCQGRNRHGLLRDYLMAKLQEEDADPRPPPYDSLTTYVYEGRGSSTGSLSPPVSAPSNATQDYDYLGHWGPRFEKLAVMYGVLEWRELPRWHPPVASLVHTP